ncbi:hypothetical protein V8G54_031696 [Vigna mungo]|uniref:Wall-associated receptor kinase galacturonan-binding domain-containing protein n=1 Tax=Vigna mungo TaxID=3915 RepID=A0AAQ3RH60_VIGMU
MDWVSAQDDLQVIAKPGCDSQCGDHEIPFPFGMNSSKCYGGKWFEIECRNTSTHPRPYLKSIGVQVTFIDVREGTAGEPVAGRKPFRVFAETQQICGRRLQYNYFFAGEWVRKQWLCVHLRRGHQGG